MDPPPAGSTPGNNNHNHNQSLSSPFPNNPASRAHHHHQQLRDDSHSVDHQSLHHHHSHQQQQLAHHDPHGTHQQQYRADESNTSAAAAALRHRLQQQQQQSNTRQQHPSPTPRQQSFQPSPTGNPSASTDHDVHNLHHGMSTQHLLPTSNVGLGNVNVANVGGVGNVGNVAPGGPSALIAPTQSSPTLWAYFKRGDKMQKTNKFEANCIFCLERQGILTKVRGEKRMMSGHLRNCANASETAKAEGEAVAIELKNRRTSANRVRSSNSAGGNTNLGINPTMRKKSKGRVPLHAAAAASTGSMMAAVAMAAAGANTNNNVNNSNVNNNAGDNSATYFKQVVSGPAFVTNDGIRIFYEERGSGHPLILIHGWSGTCKYFVRNFTTLADSFRVIQFDLRGHGESEKPTWGFHVHRLAADLHNLMDHLQLHNVAVLGCSLGCAVIWAYVELFGVQRISAAMFVDQSPWQMVAPDGSWQYGSSGAFSESAIACLSAKLQENPRGCHVKNVQMCLNRDPTPHETEFFVSESLKSEAWFLSKLMADHSNIDWRSVLSLVTCPALVIVGKRSKVFPWQGVAYAAEKMPNATLITFDEGSHWLYYEEADKFNAVVTTWLQKLHPQS